MPGYSFTPSDLAHLPIPRLIRTQETRLTKHDKTYHFVFDGQQTNRNKWIHQFDNVTMILFVTNLCHYDQVSLEDDSITRLEEDLDTFGWLINTKCLRETPAVIMFTGMEELHTKLCKEPFVDYFPDYNGNSYDVEQVKQYIQSRFTRRNKRYRSVYPLFVGSEDGDTLDRVLSGINDAAGEKAWRRVEKVLGAAGA